MEPQTFCQSEILLFILSVLVYIYFVYVFGNGVFVSFEQTDVIQFSNVTFYYYRFSVGSGNS